MANRREQLQQSQEVSNWRQYLQLYVLKATRWNCRLPMAIAENGKEVKYKFILLFRSFTQLKVSDEHRALNCICVIVYVDFFCGWQTFLTAAVRSWKSQQQSKTIEKKSVLAVFLLNWVTHVLKKSVFEQFKRWSCSVFLETINDCWPITVKNYTYKIG